MRSGPCSGLSRRKPAARAFAVAAAVAVALWLTAGSARAQSSTPWLGVAIARGAVGVRVVEVIDGTPAQAAGLAAGDEIIAVGGAPVHTPAALARAVSRHRVGQRLRVVFDRAGRRGEVTVVLAPKLSPAQLLARRLVGKPAPDFQLPVISGGISGRLRDLRGQVVVVEFFATWCAPCRSTHAALSKAAKRGQARGLTVVAISDESRATLERFVHAHRPAFAVVRDPGGKVLQRYFASEIPTLVVIDRNGIVRYAGIGAGMNVDEALFASDRALGARHPSGD